MKKSNIIRYVGIAIVVLVFFKFCQSVNADSKEREKEKIALVEKHCKTQWENLSDIQKKQLLTEFIDNRGIVPKTKFIDKTTIYSLPSVSYKLLTDNVKYPSTILIDGNKLTSGFLNLDSRNATITDVENGIIEYVQNFTSENKLSMTVKSQLVMTIKYNAGCTFFKVMDFKVN